MSIATETISDTERRRLNDLWQVAERAGLHQCSASLDSAILEYQAALAAKREVEAVLVAAQNAHDDAVAIAEMVVARQVTRESNKTFIPDGDDRRQVTADEARTWVAREVAADDDVRDAISTLRAAQTSVEEVRDRIAVAKRRIQATKHATDAAIALTNLLSVAFQEGHR